MINDSKNGSGQEIDNTKATRLTVTCALTIKVTETAVIRFDCPHGCGAEIIIEAPGNVKLFDQVFSRKQAMNANCGSCNGPLTLYAKLLSGSPASHERFKKRG